MSTIVQINVRRECYQSGEDDPAANRYVPDFAEPLDLDTLTPRARALAEALADNARILRTLARADAEDGVVVETRTPAAPLTPEQQAAWGEDPRREKRPDGTRQREWHLPRMRADDGRTAAQWLELQARDNIDPDWYPVASVGGGRVESAEAGALDAALTRNQVMAYAHARGRTIGIQQWDAMRGTGWPAPPDLHVFGRPLWRPASIDAFLAQPLELWPLSRVAEYLGYTGTPASSASSARKQLLRWRLEAESRGPGRGGESLYDAAKVRALHSSRPGRGARTDLAERS